MKGVNVEQVGDEVLITHRINGEVLDRYSVVETAKVDMAWDITWDNGIARLVAQQGCGCGGMKKYDNDPTYTGSIKGKGQR